MAASLCELNLHLEPWVSATQISNYELCNRKWAWRWLEHVRAPPNKFAQLGIDTHGPLEKWLKFGWVPQGPGKPAQLAQALIPLLPPPQAVDWLHNKNVERDELLIVDDGQGVVLFIIKVDLFMPAEVSWDGVVRPRTYDHKTSKDPWQWAPKPHEIHFDPQAALYAAWTIVKTGLTEIDLQWNYVKTIGKADTHPVRATVTDEMITPRMQQNLVTGRAIKHHLANTKRALDVAPDFRACDEYGGCPYKGKEHCAIGARERIVTIMSNDFKHQPATQQFLQNLPPPNGQAVNPPQFPPQQAPQQFQPPQMPAAGQFATPQPQQLQLPSPPQFQQPPQFQPQPQQPQFAPQQQAPQFAPQQAPQPQFQPQAAPPQFPPQQAPQQFAPPPQQPQFQPQQQPQFSAPQPPAAQQFVPPGAPPAQQEAPKPVGRPKTSKEYDMTGAWAKIMSGAIQLTGGDARAAGEITDRALAELKARQ